MVAGWDRLLPAWFTRLHPRHRTPANSILFVGAATFAFSIAGLIGVGKQEAFQLLWNASAIFYALTYLVMFAIPLVGLRGVTPKPPAWLRVLSLSGLLMTILYVVMAVFPIIKVESVATFALKISGLILGANVLASRSSYRRDEEDVFQSDYYAFGGAAGAAGLSEFHVSRMIFHSLLVFLNSVVYFPNRLSSQPDPSTE